MSEWREVTIEQAMAAIIDYRGKSPEKTSSGIPLVTAKIVKDGRIADYGEFIAEDEYESWMRRGLPKTGDVLITTEAPLGEVAQVKEEKIALAQRIILLRGRPDLLDNTYFKYHCLSSEFQNLLSGRASGTTVTGIKQSELRKIPIPLPPLPIQQQIAAILSAFDDKIELNRQMNRTLEQMARALFTSWFVDFDPVRAKMRGETPEGMDAETAALFPDELVEVEGREVPRGWRVTPFDSGLMIFGGGTPKTTNSEFWNGDIPWYSVVDVPNDGDVWVLQTEKTVTEAGIAGSSTRLLPVGTTIISARGTVGKLALTAVPMAMNQSCYGLFPEDQRSVNFTYFSTLAAVDELKRRTHGAVFDTITRDTLQSIDSVLPDAWVISAYEMRTDGLSQGILANLKESAYLAQLRDALLPRLLSGEVDVGDWETVTV